MVNYSGPFVGFASELISDVLLSGSRRDAKEDQDKSTNLSRERHSRVSVQLSCTPLRLSVLSERDERAREEVLVFQSRGSLSPCCSWNSRGSLDFLEQHCEHALVVCYPLETTKSQNV